MFPKTMAIVPAAAAAAGVHQPPGSLPGGAGPGAETPVTPEGKRARAGVPGPLAAFNAVHQRQDVADDELAKTRTELNVVRDVLARYRLTSS